MSYCEVCYHRVKIVNTLCNYTNEKDERSYMCNIMDVSGTNTDGCDEFSEKYVPAKVLLKCKHGEVFVEKI
jgi:hypothetical protein